MRPIAFQWTEDRRLPLTLPAAWSVIAESDVNPPPPVADLRAAVRGALNAPIGMPPLRDLVGPKTSVALVIDDPSRPTPIKRLVPVILTSLMEAGARPEHITGLFAVGAHEPMDSLAMEAGAGRTVVSQIGCQSFHCRDEDAFKYLGRTTRDTPVCLNGLAVEADLRILVGTIEPHPQASYGGGLQESPTWAGRCAHHRSQPPTDTLGVSLRTHRQAAGREPDAPRP